MTDAGLVSQTDVLVAGGGVAGSSLLFEMAQRGVACALLDAGGPVPAASALPAAVINPHRGRTARARPLDLAGAAAALELGRRLSSLGYSSGIAAGGVVRVAANARQAEAWRHLAATTAGLAWFPGAGLGPDVHCPFGGVRVAGAGWVEPSALLAALRSAASDAGLAGNATFHAGVELIAYRREGGELACETSGGIVRARRLVLSLGAYDAAAAHLPRFEIERGGALRVRLESPLSQAVPSARVRAVAGPVCAVITAPDEVVITGGHVPGEANVDFDRLLASAGWYLPALLRGEVVERFTALRAKRRSGAPVARRIAPDVFLLGALGGRGFLTAPLLAARLASLLAAS